MTSRKVALTAAFLALAAGGTAACDTQAEEPEDTPATAARAAAPTSATPKRAATTAPPKRAATTTPPKRAATTTPPTRAATTTPTRAAATTVAPQPVVTTEDTEDADMADEVFYCADDEGLIADEADCDDESEESPYYLWHSPTYAPDLTPGTYLDGGDYFTAYDRASRQAFRLPTSGRVTNGTVKTNVVGRASTTNRTGTTTSGG